MKLHRYSVDKHQLGVLYKHYTVCHNHQIPQYCSFVGRYAVITERYDPSVNGSAQYFIMVTT